MVIKFLFYTKNKKLKKKKLKICKTFLDFQNLHTIFGDVCKKKFSKKVFEKMKKKFYNFSILCIDF